MSFIKKIKTISVGLFILILAFPLWAQETTGWYSKGNNQVLYIDGLRVFSSAGGDVVDLPPKLDDPQEIDAYLYLAEYFMKRKSRQGVATVLYKIRLKKKDYRLADALITTLWKKNSGKDQTAQKTLHSYIQSEKNSYYKTLASNIYITLFASGEDEKKIPQRMSCDIRLPYYSFCRLFRLQYYLDQTGGKGDVLGRHYANIMRVLSPFYEEKTLHSIPFLEELDEELPSRLAFLGLANESLNFQRMIMEAEKAALGRYTGNSLERLSFLQIMAGRWEDAENSLKELADLSIRKRKSYRNKVLVKLGTISYLARKYNDSLKYFLELDFNDWSSLIVNPLLNEPLSIPEAKDLVSLAVWQTQGREAAVAALREIPQGDRVYQEEVWPRLRIAQLIMDSNPELAARIIDEISYLAQSRGWKRLEYTATLLQGYNRILEGNYRKSTVEFTKSRGILGSSASAHANDWLRLTGMAFGHNASGKRAPVTNYISASLNSIQSDLPHEELLTIRYYRPQAFDWKQFTEMSLDYLKDTNYSALMMKALHTYSRRFEEREGVYETGLFQIRSVQDRFQNLPGFQSHREVNLQDSSYSLSRATFSNYLHGIHKEWDPYFTKNIQNPLIALFPWDEKIYLFTYDPAAPAKNQWNHVELLGKNPLSTQGKDNINQFIKTLNSPKTIQIYMNQEGLDVYEFFRKMYKTQRFNLFYRFVTNPDYGKDRNLAVVGWKKNPPSRIESVQRRAFEGSMLIPQNNRLHIWDYKNLNSKSLIQMEWKNGEDSTPLSMKRLVRRVDERTLPTALVVSGDNLGIGFGSNPEKIMEWANFWLRAGTETVYYKKNLDWSLIPLNYKDMPIGVSWTKDSDLIQIARDLY